MFEFYYQSGNKYLNSNRLATKFTLKQKKNKSIINILCLPDNALTLI